MTAAYLVPCLATLRAEFNALAPGRDKGADGWIGDAAHLSRTSDHNPDSQGRVLALDIDSTGPWPLPFGDLVESLRGDSRLEYIIWNRRIASRSHGWAWRTYTGSSDPHTGHAHFSARHDHTGNNSTAPWGIEEDRMALTDDDIKRMWLTDGIIASPDWAKAQGNQFWAPATYLQNQQAALSKIQTAVTGLAVALGQDQVDEDAIAATILAGLTSERLGAAFVAAGFTPEALADAIPDTLADRVLDRLAERVKASGPTG